MHPILQVMNQVAQWFWQNHRVLVNPATASYAFRVSKQVAEYYRNLPPETKAKVDSVIRYCVEKALKHGLPLVLGEVGKELAGIVASPEVAEFAKEVVKRGVEVGVEKALEEAHRAGGDGSK